jgi:hypothetical protein
LVAQIDGALIFQGMNLGACIGVIKHRYDKASTVSRLVGLTFATASVCEKG